MLTIHKIPSLRSAKNFLTNLSLSLEISSYLLVAKWIRYNTKVEATLLFVYQNAYQSSYTVKEDVSTFIYFLDTNRKFIMYLLFSFITN
jgi:hypothetical protein